MMKVYEKIPPRYEAIQIAPEIGEEIGNLPGIRRLGEETFAVGPPGGANIATLGDWLVRQVVETKDGLSSSIITAFTAFTAISNEQFVRSFQEVES